ncbi:MAG: cardiolipin synthase B [Nevskia sp.]|nr:cardiolipin synthase B [Nevskia sp.]
MRQRTSASASRASVPRWIAAALPAWLLQGCAGLPQADQDIRIALRGADSETRLQLLRQQGSRITGVPFVNGNEVELLRDGPATYRAMEAAIDSAQRRIDMESYLFDGAEGPVIADHLLARRARGVEVHLVYDAWGSMDTPAALFDRLRQGGVHVLEFNPLTSAALVGDLNHRDHRKLLVVDSALAITGGINISETYRHKRRPLAEPLEPDTGPWRDTDVRIRGPAVAEFEALFVSTWREHGGDAIADAPTSAQRAGELMVEAIGSSPEHDQQYMYRSLLVAISLARRSVHLTTGFFAPTPELDRALRAAARRGVDVALLLPGTSTSPATLAAGHSFYEDLLESGVRIYECRDAVLHAKTAVIDGEWSTVGSSNLDWRSAALNNEINAVVLGRRFGAAMEAMFRADIAAAQPIDRTQWSQRPLSSRLHEKLSLLLQYYL